MLDDYKIQGNVKKIEVEVEAEVADKLKLMEAFRKIELSELVNTALKRFISSHKDFLPPSEES